MGYFKEEQIEQVVRHLQIENIHAQQSFFEEEKINWDWLDQAEQTEPSGLVEPDLWTLSLQLLS